MRISSVPISGDRMALAFTQNLVSILGRAGSARLSEHLRKVLLRFEAAGHGDIQDARLRRAQHILRPLQQLDSILYSERMYVSSMTIEPALANIILCETDRWSFRRKVLRQPGWSRRRRMQGRGGKITEEDVRKLSRVADASPKDRIHPYIIFSKSAPFTAEEIARCRAAQPAGW